MSQPNGPIVDRILELVRDKQGATHSRSFVRKVVSHVQYAINTRRKAVLQFDTLTTEPFRQIYSIINLFPNGIKIQGVRVDGRDLARTTLRSLSQLDLNWFRKVGPRIEAFTLVGRDILILYPAVDFAESVEIISSKVTITLVNTGTPIELADDEILPLIDLSSIVLLTRARMLETLKGKVDDLRKRLDQPR